MGIVQYPWLVSGLGGYFNYLWGVLGYGMGVCVDSVLDFMLTQFMSTQSHCRHFGPRFSLVHAQCFGPPSSPLACRQSRCPGAWGLGSGREPASSLLVAKGSGRGGRTYACRLPLWPDVALGCYGAPRSLWATATWHSLLLQGQVVLGGFIHSYLPKVLSLSTCGEGTEEQTTIANI